MIEWTDQNDGKYSVARGDSSYAIVKEAEPGTLWRWWIFRRSTIIAKGRTTKGMKIAKSRAAKTMYLESSGTNSPIGD